MAGRETSRNTAERCEIRRPRVTPLDAPTDAPVIVGVDRSCRTFTAVRLAAREARLHRRSLRIVHAFNWIADPGRPPGGELRQEAETLIEQAMAVAVETEPDLRITSHLDEGPVVTSLLRESNHAALIVVGDGGLLGCTCVPLDTTAVQVAARAGCTVLISRDQTPTGGPVLVGVDGSPGSHCALEFAFDTTARRDGELVVLRTTEPRVIAADDNEAAITERLVAETAAWRERYPKVPVRHRALVGDPVEVLIRESTEAQLVVVGSRGDQPWRSMLGSVAQGALHHSPAPVAIVRGAHSIYIQG